MKRVSLGGGKVYARLPGERSVSGPTIPSKNQHQTIITTVPRNLKITLAYDGSEFHGWQIQPDCPTIQGILSEIVRRITGEKVLPQGSGRTDAGVHALGQVASFVLGSPIPPANLQTALNDKLPGAIRILNVEEVAPDFHARHSAKGKTYRYRVYRGETCPPFLVRYVYHDPYPLDEGAVSAAAQHVIGEHDFTSFAATDPDRALRLAEPQPEDGISNVRTILSSSWHREGCELVYEVRGNGFLHHMVRNLVGTFLQAGKGNVGQHEIPAILEARSRSAAGPTAPATGLYLVHVDY